MTGRYPITVIPCHLGATTRKKASHISNRRWCPSAFPPAVPSGGAESSHRTCLPSPVLRVGGALAKPELGSPAVIIAVTTPAMMPRCVSACRAHGPRRIPARKGRCRFFPPLNKTEAPEGLAHSPGSLGQGRKLSPWERQMFGRLAAMTEFLFLFFFFLPK